ncbi:MAG: protease-like activity factor CPAF [Elusimicrobia bacterium]|nr:protease-like activity factor CPAF [Elusimicrobiota bacterium]
MKHLCRRAAASTLALLIACPAPSLWAAGVVSPVTTRTGPAGMTMPMTALPGQAVSNLGLGSAGFLGAASLKGTLSAVPQVSPSAMLVIPSAAPALGQPVSPVSVLPKALPAAPEAPEQSPAAAAQKVGGMTNEVMTFLESAGPVAQASAESAQGLGTKVFKALQGAPEAGEVFALAPEGQEAPASPASSLKQQKMLHTLYQVAAVFAEQYAPIEWKKEQFKLDLKREYDKAKAAILANPDISTREFQDLLASLVASMRDYHVSISFDSTERARLPFLVTGAEGKYFLAYIDREQLPEANFPFQLGDEVVTFDGKPTGEAVQQLAARLGGNTAGTDLRLAELFLTNRRRSRGDQVPQGDVTFSIRGQDGKVVKARMAWDYTPELVPQDVPVRDAGLLSADQPAAVAPESAIDGSIGAPQLSASSLKSLLSRAVANAIHPLAKLFAEMRDEAADNPFMIGAKKSFVPSLGKVLWQAGEDDPFHAYIFETKDGRKAGFVRIASYEGGAKEAKAFGALTAKFNKEGIKSLVIDQVNNPGGDVFYMYALLSHLTDKPLKTPHHRLIIGENNAKWAADLLLKVMQGAQGSSAQRAAPKADAEEKDEEPTASGYPVTQKFMQLFVRFAQFILKQFDAGKRFTDLTWINGVDEIDPAPKAEERYTGPILLLTNELDFSGGDFFPAVMQDNKRVTQMGVRTAGAGGMVMPFELPNQFGIADLNATWSIAERANGKPIENLGVVPDIPYNMTQKDLQTGFAEYRLAIIKAVQDLMGAAPAAAPAPAPEVAPTPKPAKRPAITTSKSRPNRPNRRK